ncbi:unnamed protein product [Prorocentrum cordatum]|uniref:Endonuclease/exonuclease/phosphatase domain-containing protein n=1 Tax=Prorocentrum cordatum TaxID=2364126 RepID=A0ABN9WFF6_9DINO|nr:unnamed protein product [Polarella glacialis]
MADDAHGDEVPASLVEQFDLAATFPSQELGAGRWKGGKGAVPPPRKRAAHDHSAAEAADGNDAWSSDDYLRQLCRDEFDSMRAALTSTVSESIRATAAENHSVLLGSIDKLREQVSGQSAAIDQQVQNVVRPQVDALSRRLQSQIDDHKKQIDACERRLGDHDDQLSALRAELVELRRHLAVAEQRPQAPPQIPTGFDRDADSTLLIAVAQRATSLEAMSACLQNFLSETGFDSSEYEIVSKGTLPCKRFAVQFKGMVQPASRKVLRALSALKDENGWKAFFADLPGLSERTRVHMGPDKSPKQVKMEYVLRKCRAAFTTEFSSLRFFTDRDRGFLSIGWDKILKVEVEAGDAPPTLRWDVAKLERHDITKARAMQLTSFLAASADEPAAGAEAAIKLNYLSKLGLDKSIVSLQEVHQDALQLEHFVHRVCPRSTVLSSFCGSEPADRARGGVAVLIPPLEHLPEDPVRVESHPLIPGRVLMVALRATRACVYLFNVHNHELGTTAITRVRDAVRAALAEARAGPQRVLVILNGDFNISEESAMSLLAPVAASRRGGRRHHAAAPAWRPIFDDMPEVQGSEPTHFERAAGKASILDS